MAFGLVPTSLTLLSLNLHHLTKNKLFFGQKLFALEKSCVVMEENLWWKKKEIRLMVENNQSHGEFRRIITRPNFPGIHLKIKI